MSMRTRKFVGTIVLLLLVAVWVLLAMTLAQSVLTNINGFVAAIYYIVAGLGWVLAAMPLISWMGRPDNAWATHFLSKDSKPRGRGGSGWKKLFPPLTSAPLSSVAAGIRHLPGFSAARSDDRDVP